VESKQDVERERERDRGGGGKWEGECEWKSVAAWLLNLAVG
jgi:hypothetical protein